MSRDLSKQFNSVINQLISRLDNACSDEQESATIDRLRRRIVIAKRELGDDELLIKESYTILKKYSDKILHKKADFFLKMNVADEIRAAGGKISSADECLLTLVESAKRYYTEARPAEIETLWQDVNKLLSLSIDYKLMGVNTA